MAMEVVVVVLTVCLDDVSIHATKRQAPNYGGRVPVDTTPGGTVLGGEPIARCHMKAPDVRGCDISFLQL